MSETSRRSWVGRVLTRDTLSFVGGWFIILYQMLGTPPGEVNEWFLLLGGSLIGVPGVAEVMASKGARTGTGGSPSPPPESASSSPPPSSSSGG